MLFHLDHLAFCFIVIVIVCSVLSLILFVFFFFLNHLFMVSNMVCTYILMLLLVPQLALLARGCFGGRGCRSWYIFHAILRLPGIISDHLWSWRSKSLDRAGLRSCTAFVWDLPTGEAALSQTAFKQTQQFFDAPNFPSVHELSSQSV